MSYTSRAKFKNMWARSFFPRADCNFLAPLKEYYRHAKTHAKMWNVCKTSKKWNLLLNGCQAVIYPAGITIGIILSIWVLWYACGVFLLSGLKKINLVLQVATYSCMYTTSSRERARGARQKNDRQPDPLLVLFGRWGGGVTKNLVEYLVEWPPKFEKT